MAVARRAWRHTLAYLQGILGYPHLMIAYWTLCLEVQFYLLLIVMLLLAHRAARAAGR